VAGISHGTSIDRFVCTDSVRQPAVLLTSFSLLRFTLYTCFPDDFTTTPPYATSISQALAFGVYPPILLTTHYLLFNVHMTHPSVERASRNNATETGSTFSFSSWVDSIESPQSPLDGAITSDGLKMASIKRQGGTGVGLWIKVPWDTVTGPGGIGKDRCRSKCIGLGKDFAGRLHACADLGSHLRAFARHNSG